MTFAVGRRNGAVSTQVDVRVSQLVPCSELRSMVKLLFIYLFIYLFFAFRKNKKKLESAKDVRIKQNKLKHVLAAVN